MYRAVRDFKDLQDNRYFYREGDVFPRSGLEVSEERLQELSTNENASHMVLIKKVETTPETPSNPEVHEVKKEKGRRKNARTNIESD